MKSFGSPPKHQLTPKGQHGVIFLKTDLFNSKKINKHYAMKAFGGVDI
jgi:hypothetical protein